MELQKRNIMLSFYWQHEFSAHYDMYLIIQIPRPKRTENKYKYFMKSIVMMILLCYNMLLFVTELCALVPICLYGTSFCCIS